MPKTDDARASGAEKFEAEIRKRARPMLSDDERAAQGRERAALDARFAAARAREAAAAQTARAEEYERQADELEKGR